MNNKQKINIGIVAVIVLALGIWYVRSRPSVMPEAQAPVTPPATSVAPPPASPPESLGEKIYDQAQNPIQDKLAEPQAPAVNPIEGVYKNPF